MKNMFVRIVYILCQVMKTAGLVMIALGLQRISPFSSDFKDDDLENDIVIWTMMFIGLTGFSEVLMSAINLHYSYSSVWFTCLTLNISTVMAVTVISIIHNQMYRCFSLPGAVISLISVMTTAYITTTMKIE